MIRDLKTFPVLEGYRGSPRRDVGALEQILLRISALVDDIPAIPELDLNPVLVHERGATVVDARIRVARSAHHREEAGDQGSITTISSKATAS